MARVAAGGHRDAAGGSADRRRVLRRGHRGAGRRRVQLPRPHRPRRGRHLPSWSCSTVRRWRSRTSVPGSSRGSSATSCASRHDRATILVATSGDTGSAVAHGFHGVPNVRVVLLYPEGRVSPFQEAQMATLGGNVRALQGAGHLRRLPAAREGRVPRPVAGRACVCRRPTRSTSAACCRRASTTSPATCP